MKKYIAEFIGTFCLVFCGCGAIVVHQLFPEAVDNTSIAIVFGLIVIAMIYAFGEISGAHINPAVTIAFWFAKKFPFKDVPYYIFAQILGGILACTILKLMFPEIDNYGVTNPAFNWQSTFVMEIILSFILMLVIINVSTGSKEVGVVAGIAIGFTVLVDAMFGGPISGASMNPARSIAPAIMSQDLTNLWIYIVAPIIGMLFAVISCKFVKDDNCCKEGC